MRFLNQILALQQYAWKLHEDVTLLHRLEENLPKCNELKRKIIEKSDEERETYSAIRLLQEYKEPEEKCAAVIARQNQAKGESL